MEGASVAVRAFARALRMYSYGDEGGVGGGVGGIYFIFRAGRVGESREQREEKSVRWHSTCYGGA